MVNFETVIIAASADGFDVLPNRLFRSKIKRLRKEGNGFLTKNQRFTSRPPWAVDREFAGIPWSAPAGFGRFSADFGRILPFPAVSDDKKSAGKKVPRTIREPRQNDKRLHRNHPKRSPVDPENFFKKVVFDTPG